MREAVERAYFAASLTLGRLLRAGSYAQAHIAGPEGMHIRKRRLSHAPVLLALGTPLMRALNTGVQILAQRAWEERERLLHETLRGTSIRIEDDGALLLPRLAGRTLATLLHDAAVAEPTRLHATALAVAALAALHRRGFTHGDAMAENVMIDLQADVAHWFDFETVHDARRSLLWRRADDVRALLATCLLRTAPHERGRMLAHILDVYADESVVQVLPASFGVWQRPLPFHLAQAPLSFELFRETGDALRARLGDVGSG